MEYDGLILRSDLHDFVERMELGASRFLFDDKITGQWFVGAKDCWPHYSVVKEINEEIAFDMREQLEVQLRSSGHW